MEADAKENRKFVKFSTYLRRNWVIMSQPTDNADEWVNEKPIFPTKIL